MASKRDSLQPIGQSPVPSRAMRHFSLRHDLLLAVLPTVTALAALFVLERFSDQRLLFSSLASSAFLIYLDPTHTANTVRSLLIGHLFAACAGLLTFLLWGHGYLAAASAMVLTIVVMILADAVHPPAVSTSLIFGFKSGSENELVLFFLAVGVVALLVLFQRFSVWALSRATHPDGST